MTRRDAKVLVVDDEPDMADSLRRILKQGGYDAAICTEATRAADQMLDERPDLVITDMRMPGADGLELFEQIRSRQPDLPVIVVTGYASVDSAVEAMKRGVADYISKPFSPDEILIRVEKALSYSRLAEQNRYLRERAEAVGRHGELVGQSPAFVEILRLVDKVAATDARVLIVGESGTGKELVARSIHRHSLRREAPFVAINCGSFSESLLESELFGHERGAFTGAMSMKKGIFEVAEGGTLFLDEICETTLGFQTRLLRVIQEGEFLRVGGTRALKTDVRILASTNRDARKCLETGCLREDLYYRLSVVQIQLPPLRERPEDIPLLVAHFMSYYSRQLRKKVRGIRPDASEALCRYRWPGNIRELENVIERALIMVDEGEEIEIDDLPLDILSPEQRRLEPMQELREAEKELLIRTLRECNWNRSLAARKLGIGRRTLYDKLARYGISLRPNI